MRPAVLCLLLVWMVPVSAANEPSAIEALLLGTWRSEGDVQEAGYVLRQVSDISFKADKTFLQYVALYDLQSGYKGSYTLTGTYRAAAMNEVSFVLTTQVRGSSAETSLISIVDRNTLRSDAGWEMRRTN